MMRKSWSICLLVLALSPCTAPFQIVDIEERGHRSSSLEPLSALRQDDDARSIVALRSSDPGGLPAILLLVLPLTHFFTCRAAAFLLSWPTLTNYSGDYSPLSTILRL